MSNPIRILHVVTYMGRGGLESMLMNYYRHIDRDRVQFDFLTHRSFRADFDDEIESLGGKIYHLPRLVPWNPSYRNALNHFFTEHKEYKIVHVHQDCLSSVILKCAARHHVPVRVAHSHNSNQDKNLKYIVKLYYRKQIPKYATALFACSQEAGNWMFHGTPFWVMNNAIDAKQYQVDTQPAQQVRRALNISDHSLVVGHVGRFSTQKNHTFLLKVFSEIHKIIPDSKLLLVGDGSLRTQIERQAKLLNIDKQVIFTGIRSDVSELMQAMDVFVFPSLYEGLPVTLVEAQAAGLSCFISDKVPSECKITDLVTQIPLDVPASQWAKIILKTHTSTRKNTYAQIAAAGYDIVEDAKWLQKFYLEQWKANE